MNTIIPSLSSNAASSPETRSAIRQPHFECSDLPQALKIVVLIPGVDAHGIEIVTSGPDLLVNACRSHVLRVNWQALHLEGVQRDYQLKLRLGHGFDFSSLRADLRDGVLTVTVPKRATAWAPVASRQRRVA
ncbi:MAG TPA: Hsp20/alpha crystallin family protein [Candidatus Didemnitutus sp.]|jgi:HSP20 family molecular chaperone IbpA